MEIQTTYKTFLQEIVDKHLPEESLSFELDGDAMAKSLVDRVERHHEDGHVDKFGAADLITAKTVLDIALVTFSVYKIILEIFKLREQSKTVDTDDMQQKWENILRKEGMKPDKAKAISEDFIKELVTITK
jgi:hypothetical protein